MTATTNFFDVIVLGTDLGPTLAGALLAKRGFRVLLLGQNEPAPTYEALGHQLPRDPFALLAAGSPIVRRVFAELALHQVVRRHARALDPAFQVAVGSHRVDLALDDGDLEREIEREFPAVRRPVDDFHRRAQRTSEELDALLDRDLVWPPESFFERREFARASAAFSADRIDETRDPFGEFSEGHPFRRIVQAPVRFADGMDPDHTTALRTYRLFHARHRGSAILDGGGAGLRAMLLDRVRAHSGEVRSRDRADSIVVRRGVATGVRIAGSGELVGCAFVVGGRDLAALLPLLPDRRPFELLFERIGEPQPRYYRYTLNLVLRREGVPVGMARDVFFVPDPTKALVAENALHIQSEPLPDGAHHLLTVESILPRRHIEGPPSLLDDLRERLLSQLESLVPFLRLHLVMVDSPHDGRPIQDVLSGQDVPPADPWSRGPQTMRVVHGYPVTAALGLSAMPVKTPISHFLLCNDQVIPGLGQEGAFLTAWAVARLIGRADRKKEWMRRGLWTKVEL